MGPSCLLMPSVLIQSTCITSQFFHCTAAIIIITNVMIMNMIIIIIIIISRSFSLFLNNKNIHSIWMESFSCKNVNQLSLKHDIDIGIDIQYIQLTIFKDGNGNYWMMNQQCLTLNEPTQSIGNGIE